jgi:hypothetical protein
MFEQTFKNIDDVLRNEAGCTTELDYTEQTSWMLFLKYLAMADAVAALGDPGKIRELFIGFQQHLYTPQAVA